MKKSIFTILLLIVAITSQTQTIKSLYDFNAKTIDGKDFDFSSLKGKKVLIVNTASKCGLTPQYEGLEELYKQYGKNNFMIIAFPANNFSSQEPGTDKEIKTFCKKNYGVTFQIMSKISVEGDDIHPIYKWLTDKKLNGKIDAKIKWNFQKFLINENGKVFDVVFPKSKPNCEKITNWLSTKK